MKILFTQDALINAGAEKSHMELISRFSPEIKAELVYFYPRHDLKEDFANAGVKTHFLDIPETYHFPLAIWRLIKLINKHKPDLLISCLWRADIISRIASVFTGVQLVGTLVNDSYGTFSMQDKKGLKHKFVFWLDKWTAFIPIHWMSNANALVDAHVKTLGLDARKISVVYRGRSVPEEKWENGREEIPIAIGRDFRFLSYGRLLERKGFQDAIQAFSYVVKNHPNCSLTIYGEGPYRSQLENLITSLGLTAFVKLPGKFEGPTNLSPIAIGAPNLSSHNPRNLSSLNLLLSSDCFLFPSWYEGFSGALVEAMMAGIPIIASDVPMNLEAITPGQNGIVFPVKNIDSLKSQMQFAIENPEQMEEFGKNARMTAIQRFDIEKIAKEYEGVLLEVFKRSVTHA
ncbi:glycosyltransferase [Algoriphagus aquimarinus]|uniref:Glycosyltransferase family 4 protein n=1 Tax=Algoriphagus aquimarinus TaxID=237018 RepID=A0A5C7ADS2_9BACT|nr:glycosyltransferase [Algoriphagus aquimarinus]TXE02401.1 glycosyltransferase family 4 protein [Algoriphagus aquimarinus]